VTLHLLEPNKFKDMVDTGLRRNVPGPGYYHFPEPQDPEKNPDGWLPKSFFDELKSEVRNEDGSWTQIKKRNESFDLCYMALALCMILKMDRKSFWDHPPAWALPLSSENSNLITAAARREMKGARPAAARPVQRRSARSAYLD
jgi:phage terminase large subunit GpA-like protein